MADWIYTHEPKIMALLKDTGFHCRGKKTAGIKLNDEYYNQVGADVSFYSINDAKTVMTFAKIDESEKESVLKKLNECEKIIHQLQESKKIDRFCQLFLENLSFQMIRESFNESFYPDEKSPFKNIIEHLPEIDGLKESLSSLYKMISDEPVEAYQMKNG